MSAKGRKLPLPFSVSFRSSSLALSWRLVSLLLALGEVFLLEYLTTSVELP